MIDRQAVKLLRMARAFAGLSQAELARRMGTSQPAIARLERGTVSPTLATLRRIATAAGMELRVAFEPIEASDPVVAAYMTDVDRSLLRENLRKSVAQRLRDSESARKSLAELRRTVTRSKTR